MASKVGGAKGAQPKSDSYYMLNSKEHCSATDLSAFLINLTFLINSACSLGPKCSSNKSNINIPCKLTRIINYETTIAEHNNKQQRLYQMLPYVGASS
jgi:hypothetical protein